MLPATLSALSPVSYLKLTGRGAHDELKLGFLSSYCHNDNKKDFMPDTYKESDFYSGCYFVFRD